MFFGDEWTSAAEWHRSFELGDVLVLQKQNVLVLQKQNVLVLHKQNVLVLQKHRVFVLQKQKVLVLQTHNVFIGLQKHNVANTASLIFMKRVGFETVLAITWLSRRSFR